MVDMLCIYKCYKAFPPLSHLICFSELIKDRHVYTANELFCNHLGVYRPTIRNVFYCSLYHGFWSHTLVGLLYEYFSCSDDYKC